MLFGRRPQTFCCKLIDVNVVWSACLYADLTTFQIGRRLIPRYFRSLFEDGVTDGYFVPRMTKETYLGSYLMAECDMASLGLILIFVLKIDFIFSHDAYETSLRNSDNRRTPLP